MLTLGSQFVARLKAFLFLLSWVTLDAALLFALQLAHGLLDKGISSFELWTGTVPVAEVREPWGYVVAREAVPDFLCLVIAISLISDVVKVVIFCMDEIGGMWHIASENRRKRRAGTI